MMPDEVKLTLILTDGRELSVTCDYMSAAERVVQAKKWPLFKEWIVEGPAASLVGPIVLRQTGIA